jgi:hypothetical protein
MLVAGWFAWDWWTHPTQLGPAGNRFWSRQGAGGLRPLHVAVTMPTLNDERETLTVTRVEANVAADSADAVVIFTVCTLRPGQDPIMSAHGRLDAYCAATRPADGAELVLGPHGQGDYLIMTLTPSRPGVVRVPSVDVTYRHGWNRLRQHGTETTGMSVRMNVG